MSYFVIDCRGVRRFTRAGLLEALTPSRGAQCARLDGADMVRAIPSDSGTENWGNLKIIIKGEIVVPQPAQGWTIE